MLVSYWRLLRRNANYRRLWLAQIVSESGDWFYSLAIYTLLLQSTGHATSVAVALVFQVLPQTFAGPAAGVLNDRLSRKQIMIAADLVRAAVVLGMLLVRGAKMVWLLYLLLFLETIMAAFFEPAHSAVIPNIVTPEEALAANTLSATTWSFVLAMGAMLGGLVAVAFGLKTVFVLNSLSFLASAFFISRMHFDEPHRRGALPFHARELVDFSPVLEGIRYLRRDVRLLVTVFLKTGVGFLSSSWVLLPVFAERIFPIAGMDPARSATFGLSCLVGARGMGALIGPLITSGWAARDQSRMRRLALGGFLVAGCGYAALSRAPTLLLACLSITFAHSGGAVIWVNSSTLLQLNSEDRFRGRVFAADLAIAMLSIAVTGFSAGRAIDAGISVRTAAFCVGICLFVLGGAWAFAMRLWRNAIIVRE
jgi:MFS family permease